MNYKIFLKDLENNQANKYIKLAYFELLKHESFLFKNDLNERTVTHRFALYLEKRFPLYYDIDCEYNRNGLGTGPKYLKSLKNLKKQIGPVQPDDKNGKTVFPDIIVHSRGNKLISWVVIEAKKLHNSSQYDEEKLRAYKKELGYKNAFLIFFPSNKRELINLNIDNMIREI